MRSVLAVGVLAIIAWPSVASADEVSPCQAEEPRAAISSTERVEPTAVAAPSVVTLRQAGTQRETAEARTDATRRRSGKRVPDAELIGPRGAL